MDKHDPDNKACPQNDAQFCHFTDLVLCACKPVDVEQTEHEKTNQNWCAVATGLQVKTEAQAAEIKRLTDALVYVDENAGNWQTQDNIWPVIAGALKQESKPSDA